MSEYQYYELVAVDRPWLMVKVRLTRVHCLSDSLVS